MTNDHGNMTKGEVCAEYYRVAKRLKKQIVSLEMNTINIVAELSEARRLAERKENLAANWENRCMEARRLAEYWQKKAYQFAGENRGLYPFDELPWGRSASGTAHPCAGSHESAS